MKGTLTRERLDRRVELKKIIRGRLMRVRGTLTLDKELSDEFVTALNGSDISVPDLRRLANGLRTLIEANYGTVMSVTVLMVNTTSAQVRWHNIGADSYRVTCPRRTPPLDIIVEPGRSTLEVPFDAATDRAGTYEFTVEAQWMEVS